MTDTRNVLLKCRHSMLSMIRYDAVAGHVVLVECHHSFSAAFNDSGLLLLLCTGVVSSFFLAKTNICIRPGTQSWYCYGSLLLDGTSPNRSIHATKIVGNTFMRPCVFFFCPISVYFLRMTLSSSFPFVTHIRGHMARTPLPSKLPCLLSF